MTTRRHFLTLLTAAALTLTLIATSSLVEGKGKPGGGGDPAPQPPVPPVEYQVTHIPYPAETSGGVLNEFSDSGMAVGWYTNSAGERRGWVYDPFVDPFSTVDLNDMPITGLEGWTILSAVGVNNNGLVVGYASPTGDFADRHGVVIDLASMEIFELPDTGWGWADTYAQKVNDNGDILGVFRRADGTYGGYLYNPGFRSGAAEDDLEIIEVLAPSPNSFDLNNPMLGFPTQIVVGTLDGSIMEYTRGGTVSYRTDVLSDVFYSLRINDFGDIAGNGSITVQVRKNRTETTSFVYRDTGVEEYLEGPVGAVQNLTNDGTVIIANSGGPTLYVDGWGFVDVNLLIASGSTVAYGNNVKMNNVGLPGFGQIAGLSEFELQILTPVAITP